VFTATPARSTGSFGDQPQLAASSAPLPGDRPGAVAA
jgi:hypothetical protein